MALRHLVVCLLLSSGLCAALAAPAEQAGAHTQKVLALGAGGKGAVVPPKNMATVRHDKEKGNGYNPGSPLYAKQENLRAAGPADEAPAPVLSTSSMGGWWWWIVVAILVVFVLCMCGLAFYYNKPGVYERYHHTASHSNAGHPQAHPHPTHQPQAASVLHRQNSPAYASAPSHTMQRQVSPQSGSVTMTAGMHPAGSQRRATYG